MTPKAACLTRSFFTFIAVILVFSILISSVYADPNPGQDHKHHRIDNNLGNNNFLAGLVDSAHEALGKYESGFFGFDQGILGKRADDITALSNNAPENRNIQPGDDDHFTFPSKEVNGPPSPKPTGIASNLQDRALPLDGGKPSNSGGNQVYISINTCNQPDPNDQGSDSSPAQLTLFISTNPNNKKPAAGNHDYEVKIIEGAGLQILNADSDIFLTVSAPSTPGFKGQYNYDLTASIDSYYAYYNPSMYFYPLDTDTNSSLLLTNNTTNATAPDPSYKKWMSGPPPFSVFMWPQGFAKVRGLTQSFCGLHDWAPIKGNLLDDQNPSVKVSISEFGGGSSQPKQQTFVGSLNGSTTYIAVMALDGNSTDHGPSVIQGGGTVGSAINFTTKADQNCAVIYNLSFCTDVAYAVPTNPKNTTLTNITELGTVYDDYARNMYTNFSKSLQQIPCNTTSSAQYSLARNCTDCAQAYKNWLCAVTIPRCEDFSSPAQYLVPRAISQPFAQNGTSGTTALDPIFSAQNKSVIYMNSSRNPLIDTQIVPGPYKEVLPCKDLCYDLIQSCPASLGFACPLKDHGLELSYGDVIKGGDITCNRPGKVWGENGAGRMVMRRMWGWTIVLGAMVVGVSGF